MARREPILLGLYRSGETRWEREGRIQGSADLPLGNAGRAAVVGEAARLAGRRSATIHHPPDEAATESAAILGRALGARPRSVATLADPHLGLFEGLHERELRDRFPKHARAWQDDPLALVPPEGEPIEEARARLLRAVGRILRKARRRETSVVLHPLAFGLVACRLEEQSASEARRYGGEAPRSRHYLVLPALAEQLEATEA